MAVEQRPDVSGFWGWFAEDARALAELVASGEAERQITQRIDAALTRFGLPDRYEVSTGTEGPELVFSAEGDRDWGAFLQDMVRKAPSTAWTIHPARPRRPLEAALSIVRAVHGVALEDARFQTRFVDGRFHLRFLHDDLFQLDEAARHEAAALLLDYALGERVATEIVGGLDFQPTGEGITMSLMVNEMIRKAEAD